MRTNILVIISALFLCITHGFALPRFAALTGAKCQSCHVNPSGGEMRQAFGVQYGREQLPVPEWSKDYSLDDFSNLLGNVLGIGADFQTLYFSQKASSATTDAFFQMQGDLYLNFRVARKVNLFFNKGLYNGFEVFALLGILPANGGVKVGKFVPAYGTKMDDHTTFIRTYTGFSPELARPELTGVEVDISPGPITVIGGVFNSSDGFGAAEGNDKAYLGRVEGMFGGDGTVHVGVGGNVWYNAAVPQSVLQRINLLAPVQTSGSPRSTLYGGFGSLGVGKLAVLSEVDWMQLRSDLPTTKSFVCYVEGDYPLITGLDLKLAYDFYDPDITYKNGSITRYTAGVEFFPFPGVEVRPLYRVLHGTNVDLQSEFDLLLHLYF